MKLRRSCRTRRRRAARPLPRRRGAELLPLPDPAPDRRRPGGRRAREGDQVQRAAARGRRHRRHAARHGGGRPRRRRTCRSRSSSRTTTWSCVNKPAGMVVHPGGGQPRRHARQRAAAPREDLSGIGGEARPGIVHRLDKGTSGVMVVAKNDAAIASCRGSSTIGRSRRNTSRWCGAWCSSASASRRPSAATRRTVRRCRRGPRTHGKR